MFSNRHWSEVISVERERKEKRPTRTPLPTHPTGKKKPPAGAFYFFLFLFLSGFGFERKKQDWVQVVDQMKPHGKRPVEKKRGVLAGRRARI